LFIVLSLFIRYLFMVGNVPASFSRAKGRLLEQAALTIGIGILVNYCLMLTGLTITRVFIAGIILALWGVRRFWTTFLSRRDQAGPATMFSVCCIICLLAVYYVQILAEPLVNWDARSIWFFHARMIWAEGALRQSAGWNHPSLAFSNPDYPKLVPTIAAQLAYMKGYWNEFLPKGSLFVMLVPVILWVFSFGQKSVSFILLLLMFFFSLDAWLWNGYMDGYVVLYGGAALLLFGRYLSEGRDVDLYSGMCALGIAASLKNEGLLFGFCLITALLIISLRSPAASLAQCMKRFRTDSVFARVLLLSVAPTVMWTICKMAWGLQNDLAANPSSGLVRLANRLVDGSSSQYVLNFMIVRASATRVLIGVLAVAVMFSVYKKVTFHRGALVAATTSALYVCGIYLVYLSTPHDDLPFYMFTSASRTMTTASVALLVAMFFLLSGLEVNDRDPEHRSAAMVQSAP
jgi:hypothetical protein